MQIRAAGHRDHRVGAECAHPRAKGSQGRERPAVAQVDDAHGRGARLDFRAVVEECDGDRGARGREPVRPDAAVTDRVRASGQDEEQTLRARG